MIPNSSIRAAQSPQFANASMTAASKFLLETSSYLGIDLSSQSHVIQQFFQTGGYGMIPLVALADDLNEFRKRISKISNSFSLSAQMGFASVGSEVIFDCYELLSSIGKAFDISSLEAIADNSSELAMNIKVIGSITLALSAFDEAYAETCETTGYLGSIPSTNSYYSLKDSEFALSETFIGKILREEPIKEGFSAEKISAILRAGEVGFAAISNVSLLLGQGPNTAFAISSMTSNAFKYARMSYNSYNGL